MSCIVKNCPSCIISPNCCAKYHIDNGHAKDCQDIEDCVIKQVIEVCKREAVTNYPKREKEFITINGYQAILNMFNIEEVTRDEKS